MTTPNTTTATTAIPAIIVVVANVAAAANNAAALLLLSNASTPAGSANTSPVLCKNAHLAPKKLIVRQPLRASFKIESQTIFPSTEAPMKVWNAQIKRDKEDDEPYVPAILPSAAAQDAEIARNLPAITYRKKDQYGNPQYRPWAPLNMFGEGGCPTEDHMVVLVHFAKMPLEKEEDTPKAVYMNFETYKKHMKIKGVTKEWPIAVRFGADLQFYEDEQLRANRMEKEAACADGKAVFQKKGLFSPVWRMTHADHKGYDKFMAGISANLKKRSWADI